MCSPEWFLQVDRGEFRRGFARHVVRLRRHAVREDAILFRFLILRAREGRAQDSGGDREIAEGFDGVTRCRTFC